MRINTSAKTLLMRIDTSAKELLTHLRTCFHIGGSAWLCAALRSSLRGSVALCAAHRLCTGSVRALCGSTLAHETHAHETYAHETHAHETHAHETHAHVRMWQNIEYIEATLTGSINSASTNIGLASTFVFVRPHSDRVMCGGFLGGTRSSY